MPTIGTVRKPNAETSETRIATNNPIRVSCICDPATTSIQPTIKLEGNEMKYPNASGIYDISTDTNKIELFVYRSSYAGGSETTITVEGCIYPLIVRNSYNGNFCAQFDNGNPGTVFVEKTRNAAITHAIEFLVSSTRKDWYK
jgi:hypothetical protein